MTPELRRGQRFDTSLIDLMKQVVTRLENERSGPDIRVNYVLACPEIYDLLKHAISERDLEDLVYSKGNERLHNGRLGTREANTMASTELEKMIERLNSWMKTAEHEIEFWKDAGTVVVPDTNVFLHALPDAKAQIDDGDWWRREAGISQRAPFILVILNAVIKELDQLKDRGPNSTRSRARWTIKRFNTLLGATSYRSKRPLNEDDSLARVTWVPEDLTHRPLADVDSEIIDRSLALQGRTSCRVVLLTRDTGLALRATHLSLDCRQIPLPESGT